MIYLEQAKKLKKDYDWQITFEDYDKQECFEELLDNARNLRNTIIGVSIMKNCKSKHDEDAVKILDTILNCSSNTRSKSEASSK